MPYEGAFYIPKKTKSTQQGFVRKGEKRNRPRDPQPGQGSIRVTNPDEITWLPSDPRHPSRSSPPKLSRFASVIGEETARRAPPSPIAGASSNDPLFGAPLFSRPPESSPIAGPAGPFPAGPRREATPYSASPPPPMTAQERRAQSPAAQEWEAMRRTDGRDSLSDYYRGRVASGLGQGPPLPVPTPAEEWARMHPQGGDALSDYYSAQLGSPQRQAQDAADAEYRMTAEYRNRKLERLRRQGEAAADYRMSDEYRRKKAARLQAEEERRLMEQAIADFLRTQAK